MPRVAHVISTPAGVGGAERVVGSLVHGALERGWEAVVLNPFGREGSESELAAICAPAHFESRTCDSIAELPALRRWLGRELDRGSPDIVHVHLFHAAVATASLGRRSDRRTILTHHHGDHFVHLGRLGHAVLDRWAGSRYDRVVAISEAIRHSLCVRYGPRGSRVVLIRNGWDGTPRPPREPENPTVISVANFRREKGHEVLLRAFALVVARLPQARLVLVGEGELEGSLRELVTALGIEHAVNFRGRVGDVWPELAQANVFALASHYETLGIAVLEAMAAGLPVVASAVGGVPELVEGERTGLLVPPNDPDALGRALLELLNAPITARSMGAAGAAAASNLTAARMRARYFELYDELLAPRSPSEATPADSPGGASRTWISSRRS